MLGTLGADILEKGRERKERKGKRKKEESIRDLVKHKKRKQQGNLEVCR